jgi:hypothetical protein
VEPTIASMWAAVLWVVKNEARINEALAHQAHEQGRPPDDEAAIDRLSILTDTAIFLGRLSGHESVVTEILKNGDVDAFPLFSRNTANIQPGDIGLMRVRIREVEPDECRVRVEANRISQSLWAYRTAIVGVERTPPR